MKIGVYLDLQKWRVNLMIEYTLDFGEIVDFTTIDQRQLLLCGRGF